MSFKLDDPLFILALAGVGGAALYIASEKRKNEGVFDTVGDVINRGVLVSHSTMGNDGVVLEEPSQLAEAAGVSEDVYALARMIRSEGAAQGMARAHVAMNDLAGLGWDSLRYLITYSTAPWAEGRFGRQFSAQYKTSSGSATWDRKMAVIGENGKPVVIKSQTRRYSSARDPYTGDITLAIRVIADHDNGIDPTGGAVKFLDKSAMGVQEGTSRFDAVDARWRKEGLVGYSLPQFGDDLVFYRRV